MAKGVFKGNNRVILAVVIAFVALVLFYAVKRREGFQGNPTVPVGPPTTIPATNTMPPTNNLDATMSSMGVMPSSTTMPSSTPMPSSVPMPEVRTAESATSVAVVKAKLDELKTLVDSM